MKKVFVGLSGGVDSALSAAFLKEQGYDVTGVFIETWHPDFLPCTWKDDRREAMRAAAHLDIPFISLDLSEKYKTEVAGYFIEEYRKGRTPNPDVMCNRSIKFGGFMEFAKMHGADFVATGHYAQIQEISGKKFLAKSPDASKDQSYFLWMLTESDLQSILFPIGSMTKEDVRKEAAKRNLPQATRKDSQGICFLGAVDLPEFLSKFIPLATGAVLNEQSKIVGEHRGAAVYTIGERHGFTVTDSALRHEPLYVLATDIANNTVSVGPVEHLPTYDKCSLSMPNVTDEALMGTLEGVLRYHGKGESCSVSKENGGYMATFQSSISEAVGQSLVLYKNNVLVGGGIVEKLF